MTGLPRLAFPGSRPLAGWWKQVAPLSPQALWIAHLLLHHVEALVVQREQCHPDEFTLLLLEAMTQAGGGDPAALAGRLHLETPLLLQLLHQVKSEDLVTCSSQGQWSLTALGQHALRDREYPRSRSSRRIFHFLERGLGESPGPYVNLQAHSCAPWPAGPGWKFDPSLFQACLAQPEEWKRRHGFPLNVIAILGAGFPSSQGERGRSFPEGLGSASAAQPSRLALVQSPDWQQVILDNPERLVTLLIRVLDRESGNQRLIALPVQQDIWALAPGKPALQLDAGWQEVFPELTEDPPLQVWRQAWREWCGQRGMPPAEADQCSLQRREYVLSVTAGKRFVARLQAQRSDALKGEAWVCAGEGRIRSAALVEIVEQTPAS